MTARLVSALGLPPLRLMRLHALASLPPPTVQEDLDFLVPSEIPD